MALKLVFNPFTGTLDWVDEGLPAPSGPGQVPHTLDGVETKWRTPMTSDGGWMVNDEGHLIVVED